MRGTPEPDILVALLHSPEHGVGLRTGAFTQDFCPCAYHIAPGNA